MGSAAVIVAGRVIAVEGDGSTGTLAVDRVLRDETTTPEIRVRWDGGPLTVGQGGVWLLGEGEPHPVLAPNGPTVPRRQVERVLGGLPAIDEAPQSDVLRNLYDRAEVVAFARIVGRDDDRAIVRVVESLKGDVPPETVVTRDLLPDAPGGPWAFVKDTPTFGVLFLQHRAGDWRVMNPTDPTLYAVGDVRAAVER